MPFSALLPIPTPPRSAHPGPGDLGALREGGLEQVRELTGSSGQEIAAATPLMDAGIDSMRATELANQLSLATGLALSSTLLFEHPTSRDIAGHIVEQLTSSRTETVAQRAMAYVFRAAADV